MRDLRRTIRDLRFKIQLWTASPRYREALKLIEAGQGAEKAGRFEEALRHYQQAVDVAPRLAKAHMNLGNALLALHQEDKALECYLNAVALEPDLAAAHYNLGNAYWHKMDYERAMHSYLAATDLDRKFAMPWVAIANMCASLNRREEAIDACRHAIAIDKRHAEAYFVLSLIYKSMEEGDLERSYLKKTLELEPSHLSALLNIAVNYDEAMEFEEGLRYGQLISDKFADSVNAQTQFIYRSSLSPSVEPDELFRRHCRAGERIEGAAGARRLEHKSTNDPDKVLRIGFVSADFFNHAVYYFIEPILRFLVKRTDIVAFGYYNNTIISDETRQIRSLFHHWRDVRYISDDVLSDGIASDGIDILVDLSGFTDGNRLGVFARKPAPIQASWIGYPGTTGMRAMDYYIADPHFLPSEIFSGQFVEKLVYLPSTAPYEPISVAPPVNRLPALASGRFTFGSFNRPSKIHRRVAALWAKVLHAVPTARMLLAAMSNQGQIDTLTRWFEEDGIETGRLAFERRGPVDSYMKLHHEVDLCLDTFPYTGGTTTRHALWMGVPTLTIAGRTPASRQGPSILELMGLGDFVASSTDEYVALARRWTESLGELESIRLDARARYSRSPLGAPELVASAFADAARIMWKRWCAGEPAEPIDVSNKRQ